MNCYCGNSYSVVRGVCWKCQEWDWRHHDALLRAGYSESEILIEMIRWGREQRELREQCEQQQLGLRDDVEIVEVER